ncbi:alpha/beta fold hydrolase [Croceiramulus getboli]|nr:alpha/beta hydrolase [Flavobacteriaceae bacterium YJPT1-3]
MKTLITLVFTLVLSCSWAQQEFTAFEVKVTGSGDPILLFPGFSCTQEVWKETIATLSEQYECHAFTFAGFGEVPPIDSPWLDTIKEQLLQYVTSNHLEQPHLLGHSLGGTLSLWLAAEHGDQFGELVVVDALPAMGALMIPNFKAEHIAYDTPYNKQMLAMSEEAFGQMAVQMATGMTTDESKRTKIANWIEQTDRETYVYGYTDLLKMDMREGLPKIKNKVTLLAATVPYGRAAAEQTYKTQYEGLKDYELHFAEGSAHFIMFDKPEWFKDQITQAFLLQ